MQQDTAVLHLSVFRHLHSVCLFGSSAVQLGLGHQVVAAIRITTMHVLRHSSMPTLALNRIHRGFSFFFGRGRFLMENCHKHIRHCTNLSLSLASCPYSTLFSNLRHSAWPFARSKRPTATQRIFARAKSRDRRSIGLGIFGNLKCHVIFEMPAELIS